MLNVLAAILGTGVAASTTSYESIATVTVGAGGSSSISFSSIPSTFKHLQVRAMTIFSTFDVSATIRFNDDSASNYSYHQITGNGSSTGAGAGSSLTLSYAINGAPTSSAIPGAGIIDILDYTSTSKTKTFRSLNGTDANGNGIASLYSGAWYKTPEAITKITLAPNSGLFNQYSKFALYGIKG